MDWQNNTSEAREALDSALKSLHVDVDSSAPTPSLRIRSGTADITVVPRAETIVSTQRAAVMISGLPSPSAEPNNVVVADEISRGARQLLTDAGIGWFDRRGNIRIWSPPLMIDTAVPAQPRAARTVHSTDAIKGRGGLAFAVELLLAPQDAPTLTAIARRSGLALSSVSEGASVVRAAGLVRSDGRPLVPELFVAVTEAWRPKWRWLAESPALNDASRTGPLALGLDNVSEPGWALTESRAAIGWGAPLVVSGAYPPALYVPEPRIQRRALDLYGEGAPSETRGARIAIAPLPVVCSPRYKVPGEGWLGTHPLFVALDLAQDPARGAQALGTWQPPSPFERVW